MPVFNRAKKQSTARTGSAGRTVGAALVVLGLAAATACTPAPEPETVADPVRILQNVRVALSPSAGVETITGTTVSVSAQGNSSAEDTEYEPAEAMNELPVRVSLQYRAGDKSGSDLAELQGHTGPVEINLTLENLTVAPRVLEYDAGGQTRSETALVGAPLTVAASTRLEGIQAKDITPGSADGASGTNGVVSTTGDGAAVVQWATLLAPPSSGASTTLRLAADVSDFQVPTIELAVQPGIATDLSTEGIFAGAFGSGPGSEMELQRRTITLVSEVNTVLLQAGSTITEVRRNLQETSQTLGVRTAGELRDNSQALAATMSGLKDQLQVLGGELETAAKATQSTTTSQLQQTVSAVDAMLGDTSAAPPSAPVDGSGCEAEVAKPEQASTVYSSILTMAAQLDAYATVSADCRDAVAGAIISTMGPENPTPQECAAQGSMTCFLYGSTVTVTAAMLGLVQQADDLVAGLQPQLIGDAIADHEAAAASLEQARADLQVVLDGAEPAVDYRDALANVGDALGSARSSVDATRTASAAARESIDGLRQQLLQIRQTAQDAQEELAGGPPWNRSMTEQADALAAELCDLVGGPVPLPGQLTAAEAERLRSYLTAVPCDPEGSPLTPPFGYQAPLDARLEAQSAAWDQVLGAVDTSASDSAIAEGFSALEAAVEEIDVRLDAVEEAVEALDGAATGNITGTRRALAELDEKLAAAAASSADAGTTLDALKTQQDELGENIKKSLEQVSDDTAGAVEDALQDQIRQVAEIGSAGSESVIDAFNRSISGLETTSDGVVADARGTVDKQRGELLGQSSALAARLDETTQSSLANIAAGTTGSTRDIEGAGALLASSLNKVMLDLGDRSVNGSGLLGSMATSAAKADTADYQLALASQNAEGYANIRSRDVAGLLLRQAQFRASLTAVDELPPFQLNVPSGATAQTLYTLTIGAGE